MTEQKKIKSFYNVGAGNLISMEIKALGWNRKEFAAKLVFTQKEINQILKNEIALTKNIADKIEQITSLSSQMLLDMDAEYQTRKMNENRPIYAPATVRYIKEM